MIPTFPHFKPIELADRTDVDEATRGFAPYSEFNFVALWCWSRGRRDGLSRLAGNLIVREEDRQTGDLLFNFLGTHRVLETATHLIAFAREHGAPARLRAVPEGVVAAQTGLASELAISEDRDYFDYLLSVADWVALHGGGFRTMRNAIHQLERRYDLVFRALDVRAPAVQDEIRRLCHLWADQKGRIGWRATRDEFAAIDNLFALGPDHRLAVFGVYERGILRGFSANEARPDGYAMGHFWKADDRFQGLYPYLLHKTCVFLAGLGVRYLNIEMDLGDDRLARAKRLLRPCGYLKKYIVTEPRATADLSVLGHHPSPTDAPPRRPCAVLDHNGTVWIANEVPNAAR